MTVFRPFCNGTFLKNSYLQEIYVKFRAKYQEFMFHNALQNNFNNYFLTSFYRGAVASSTPKNCFDFTSFVHNFNIFTCFLVKTR